MGADGAHLPRYEPAHELPHEFKATEEPDEKKNACDGYDNAANLSLRTVFAVGFDDSAVMDLH